jgi:hypothetical protein
MKRVCTLVLYIALRKDIFQRSVHGCNGAMVQFDVLYMAYDLGEEMVRSTPHWFTWKTDLLQVPFVPPCPLSSLRIPLLFVVLMSIRPSRLLLLLPIFSFSWYNMLLQQTRKQGQSVFLCPLLALVLFEAVHALDTCGCG